ncbi:MAG: carbohydrate ABC transporter permease [Acholeplasmataceae bacterium]|nr:carbohydrate ABC transporter permease [Acholeplasmataceae bacterium]
MINPRIVKNTKIIASYSVKLLIGLAFISPLIVGLMFSIHTETELSQLPLRLFPKVPTLENYAKVFTAVPILHYLKNSLIVCGVAIVSQIILASLAAYGFVFFDFPLKNLFWTTILATMITIGTTYNFHNHHRNR